jgi:hypothetical protein
MQTKEIIINFLVPFNMRDDLQTIKSFLFLLIKKSVINRTYINNNNQLISTALLLDSIIRNSVCTPAKLPCRRVEMGYESVKKN